VSVRRAVLTAAAVAAASIGLSTGVAHADPKGPYTWCPGQQKSAHMPHDGVPGPASPGPDTQWDWSVCHTFWLVTWGNGNVPGPDQTLWDGIGPPPPDAPPPPGVINADNCQQLLGMFCPKA
jgi:hypothetical protein